MFITFGDIFLPSPTSYDELYYEIIRMSQLFDNLHAVGTCQVILYCSMFDLYLLLNNSGYLRLFQDKTTTIFIYASSNGLYLFLPPLTEKACSYT